MNPQEVSPISVRLSEVLLVSLRDLYSDTRERENPVALQTELTQLVRILPQIAANLKGKYELDKAIDRGGAGILLRVVEVNLSELLKTRARKGYRALEVPRTLAN